MSDPSHQSRRELAFTAGLAGVAALLTVLATRHGPGLTPDSVYYLSTGQNLADHGELRQMLGTTLTVFPPGLPVLIGAGVWLGLGPESAARIVCVLSAAAIVVLSFELVRMIARTAITVWTVTSMVALSPVVLAVDRMAWTEPPFLVVTLGTLVLIVRIASRGLRPAPAIGLIGLCWAAFLLRYAAVALIPLCVVSVCLISVGPLRRRAATGAGFAAAAALVPLLWIRRNHDIDGSYMGPRSPSIESLPDVLSRVTDVLSSWVVPTGPAGLRAPLLVALTTIVTVAVVLAARRGITAGDTRRLRLCAPLIGFVVVYVTYLVVAQLTTRLDPIDSRLLSPVYVPLLILVAVAIEAGVRSWGVEARPVAAAISAAAVLAFAWTSLPATATAFTAGVGFNAATFRSSPTSNAVAGEPSVAFVIANGEIPAYLMWVASRADLLSWIGSPAELEAYATTVHCARGRSMLAWIGPFDPLLEAGATGSVRLTLVSQHDDGALYEISVDPAAPIAC